MKVRISFFMAYSVFYLWKEKSLIFLFFLIYYTRIREEVLYIITAPSGIANNPKAGKMNKIRNRK